MKKMLLIAVAAASLAACGATPSRPGEVPPARGACQAATQVGAAADVISEGLLEAGVGGEKIAALVPLIQTGRLLVTATCAILVPPSGP